MSAEPERYAALPNGEPDFDRFACQFSRRVTELLLLVRNLIDVAVQKRHFNDEAVTIILMTCVRYRLVDEERFFSQLGVEWYGQYGGSLERLVRGWGDSDDFLSHPDRRQELLETLYDAFQA